ncbi:SRPBCC domain-containing protein [Streptomyces sp. NPDC002588]|uniref:SRPBCC domain-containing protein n=1 Tax=Streptomyces sp. NPDC002588 TaxID=3154419 RepID=UPI00331FA59A
MRQVYRSVHVEAAPADVWRVLADFENYPAWNPFIREGSGHAVVGTTLTLRFFPAEGRPMTFRPTVLAADEGRLLRWRGRMILPGILDGTHQFVLSAVEGGTLVEQSEFFSGVLVPALSSTIGRVGGDFERLNAALKSHTEKSAAGRSPGR